MRILITGITGFVGIHLARRLLEQGELAVFGLGRRPQPPSQLAGVASYHPFDLSRADNIERLLRELRPERIYHLAGYANAGRSHREPDQAWAGNLAATLRFYDALAAWGGEARVLHVSSGAVYGEPADPSKPVDEITELRPNSPYSASKAAADLAAFQYWRSLGLDIVRVRPFNHIGPGQPPDYAVASFARQIAAIEKGIRPPILQVGNLAAERDFTDVRDVVRAYILLLEHGQAGEVYNLGSGETVRLQSVLCRLLSLARVPISVQVDPDRFRPGEASTVRVSASRLCAATGWRPEIPLDQTIADTLGFWRVAAE